MGRSSLLTSLRPAIYVPAFLLALTPAWAQVAAPPAPAQQTAAQMRLQPLVQRLVSEANLPATVVIYVEDASGAVAANVNGTRPVSPASNNKLVTTAAALSLLKPDFKTATKFFAGGPIADGTLKGDLVIYGGGDPAIGGRYQEDKKDITAIMRGWADKLKAAGIKTISGNIVADDSYFDDVYFHPNWYESERGEWYEAEVSALAFNDNCIDLTWSGKGKLPDELAGYTMAPKTDYVEFVNEVKVAAKGRDTERYYNRKATGNRIVATGSLTVDTTNIDSAAIHDGALYCAHVFADVLKKQGITVTGKPVKTRGAAEKLPSSSLLFEYAAPSMLTICQTINLNSQNFYAECVAKILGKVQAGEGSYQAGMSVIENFCKQNGMYSEGHNAVDGSGLARENKVTGRQLVSILRYMDNHGLKDQWRSTLPQGQVRGSLKSRFDDAPAAVARRIYGKTGLIGGVRSLSGFVVDAAGNDVYYSIVLNDLKNSDAAEGMKLIDKVAVELAKSGK